MKMHNETIAILQVGEQPPPDFQSITTLPLVIIIGLTGVGKSTVVSLVAEAGISFTLLPNRREIADRIIIPALQAEDGQPLEPVRDRVKRFEYTGRYRAKYPGGVAHALSLLAVDPARTEPILIFDGLRGLEEVQQATKYFPQARFVVLDAPDMIRLKRILKRSDAFDTTTITASLAGYNTIAAFKSVPDIEAVFSEEALRQIARTVRAADLSLDDVLKKMTIIVEERRNYDPSAARVHLSRLLPPERALVVDTAAYTAEEVAERIVNWLPTVK